MSRAEGLPDCGTYLRRFARDAHAAGFVVIEYGESAGAPLLLARRPAATPGAPEVLVSAGIHGDEPAGPVAVFSCLNRGWLMPSVGWTVFPLLNPTGWDAGTRGCASGFDLNRDYRDRTRPEVAAQVAWVRQAGVRYDWALSLHEDWEATGAYVYELCAAGCASMARELLDAAAAHIAPDPAAEIDGMPAYRGIIAPGLDDSQELPLWPEALWLARDHAARVHTLETPSSWPIHARVAAMEAALLAGLAALRRPMPEEDFMI